MNSNPSTRSLKWLRWSLFCLILTILGIGIYVFLFTDDYSSPRLAGEIPEETASQRQVADRNIGLLSADRDPLPKSNPSRGIIEFSGSNYDLAANARYEFPRFYVPENARVAGSASFPDLPAGSRIVIDAVDGGFLETTEVRLDSNNQAHFELQLPAHEGAHRVTLRHGPETRTFEFWVGEEPPVVVRRD